MTMATMAEMKMTSALDKKPMPTSVTITDVHAMPGMVRTRSNTGRTSMSILSFQAMKIPRGMPMTAPIR